MSRLRPLALAAISVLALCAFTGSAAAKTLTQAPVADCKAHNGTLTKTYTPAELKKALSSISPSVNEYTTCYSVIQNQLNRDLGLQNINGAGSGSGSGGGGSGTLILIIVVVIVVLLGGGSAFWAHRRNSAGGSGPDDPA